MTKVLYVDISLDGHRKKYLEQLCKINNSDSYEIFVLISQKTNIDGTTQYEMKSNFNKRRTLITYAKFIKEIKKIADTNDIDVIHFLCGDALYRFFGIGLTKLKRKIVITYHHMVLKGLKKYSIKRIFKKSTIGIVHTQKLINELKSNSIENSKLVDYPMLDYVSTKNLNEAKEYFKLPLDTTVLGVIGGTSSYKGLDFLIKALNEVNEECCLFVAGKIINYDENFINTNLKNRKIRIVTCLRKLTDEEFADAIQASDVIMLPYRLEFDGASGILIESLFHSKHVIGSNHGSMGNLIKSYDLGRTFDTNDINKLVEQIQSDIKMPYVLSEKSKEYKEMINPERFLELNKKIYEIL